jgi:hypothetical protein
LVASISIIGSLIHLLLHPIIRWMILVSLEVF